MAISLKVSISSQVCKIYIFKFRTQVHQKVNTFKQLSEPFGEN